MRRRGKRTARSLITLLAVPALAAMSAPAAYAGTAASPAHVRRHSVGLAVAPPARVAVPQARSYVLVDVATGKVLAGFEEHLRLPPASLTKVVTALVAVGYLHSGTGVSGTKVSEAAYPNLAFMEPGVAWPLDDVLQALLVYSANDAAYALAQKIGGSLSGFQHDLAAAATQLGMADHPRFTDPAGLDGHLGFGAGNLASARDLAIAGRALLRVPQLAAIVKQRMAVFVDPLGRPHALPTMDGIFLQSYPGAIGIKTGFTDLAGSCIMAAATRHGRTMLAVVMNGYNPQQTAMDLLDQGFATPVAAETGADVLPPVHLPRPTVAHPLGTSKARVVSGTKKSAATGRATPGATSPAPRSHSATTLTHARTASGGLGAVLGSWFGKLLLLLSIAGAGAALSERAKERRAREHAEVQLRQLKMRSRPPARPGYRVVREPQRERELHRAGR